MAYVRNSGTDEAEKNLREGTAMKYIPMEQEHQEIMAQVYLNYPGYSHATPEIQKEAYEHVRQVLFTRRNSH